MGPSTHTVAFSALVVDASAIHLSAFGTGEDGRVFHIAGHPVVRAMASTHMRRAAVKAAV